MAKLSKRLGCPVVETSALKGQGMDELIKTAVDAAKKKAAPTPDLRFVAEVEGPIKQISDLLGSRVPASTARWYAIKLLEGEQRTIDSLKLPAADLKTIDAAREAMENALDDDAESVITVARYDAIGDVVAETVKKSAKGLYLTQKIDRVVTNRGSGLPIFIVVMAFVYWLAISVGTGVVTDWANDGISGDGFLYTGGGAYEEAVGAWEEEVAAAEEAGASEDELAAWPRRSPIPPSSACGSPASEPSSATRLKARRWPTGCRAWSWTASWPAWAPLSASFRR